MRQKKVIRGFLAIDRKILALFRDICADRGLFLRDAAEEAILQWMEKNDGV